MREYIIDYTQIRKDREKRIMYIILTSIIFFIAIASSKEYDLQGAFLIYSMLILISILISVFDNKITKIRIDKNNQNFEYHYKNKVGSEKSRTINLADISSALYPKRKSFWLDNAELIIYKKKAELFKIKSNKGYSLEVLKDIYQTIDKNNE